MSKEEYTDDILEKINDIRALPRNDLKNIYNNNQDFLRKKDKLGFFAEANNFLEDIKRDNNKNGYSKLNLVQGLRGCGKTTFTKIVLLKLHEQSKLEQKIFIPIIFNPRYLDKKNIDEAFFDLLVEELTQYQWSNNLRSSIKGLLNAIDNIDNSRINIFKTIRKIFEDQKQESVDNKIYKIAKIINTEYKDTQIVIRIDEIDRLEQTKLMELGELLDIIKKLTELCNNFQCVSFFSWNNQYLSKIKIPGSGSNEKFTFEEYFARFKYSQINIYEKALSGLTKIIFKRIAGENKGLNETTLPYKIFSTLKILESKNIAVVMRNTKALLYQWEIAVNKYEKNKKISEISFEEIITDEVRIAYLYFGHIYLERNSIYPSGLIWSWKNSFEMYISTRREEEIEKQRKEHGDFFDFELNGRTNNENIEKRTEDTFKYVDGLINKKINVFEKKEMQIFNKKLIINIETGDIDKILSEIQKHKEIYFEGKNIFLSDLFSQIPIRSNISELGIRLIEALIKEDFPYGKEETYQILKEKTSNLTKILIRFMKDHFNSKTNWDLYIIPIINGIEIKDNILIKILLYTEIKSLMRSNSPYLEFENIYKKNNEDKLMKIINNIIKSGNIDIIISEKININEEELISINKKIIYYFEGTKEIKKIINNMTEKMKIQLIYSNIEEDRENKEFIRHEEGFRKETIQTIHKSIKDFNINNLNLYIMKHTNNILKLENIDGFKKEEVINRVHNQF